MGPQPISDEAITAYLSRHGIYRLDLISEIDMMVERLDAVWLEDASRRMKEQEDG